MNVQPLAKLLRGPRPGAITVTPTPSMPAHGGHADGLDARSARHLRLEPSFTEADLEPALWTLLQEAEAVVQDAAGWRSRVRVSAVHERLFLHSAFRPQPPMRSSWTDSYRFADLIAAELASGGATTILMSGPERAWAGWCRAPCAGPRSLSDINPTALELARINAGHAGVDFEVQHTGGLDGAPVDLDLIVSNPRMSLESPAGPTRTAATCTARGCPGLGGRGHAPTFPRAAGSSSIPAARSSTAASTSSAKPWSRPSPRRDVNCATANWTRTSPRRIAPAGLRRRRADRVRRGDHAAPLAVDGGRLAQRPPGKQVQAIPAGQHMQAHVGHRQGVVGPPLGDVGGGDSFIVDDIDRAAAPAPGRRRPRR